MSDVLTADAPIGQRDDRLLSRPFVAVTLTAFVFFVYIGILAVTLPPFVENELGAGEFGIGLMIASFAVAAIAVRPLIGWIGDVRGRRILMVIGALVAGVAGLLVGFVDSLGQLLVLRGFMGIGEAALFVGAATMIADLAPPHRRAEAASYFSVAVFGGLGIGPIIGELLLGDDRWVFAFVVAGVIAMSSALVVFAVPRSSDVVADRGTAEKVPMRDRFFHPAAIWPGLVLASSVGAFAAYSAFIPEHARSLGMAGAAGLFTVYSVVCLVLRILGAKVPERLGPGRSVTIALSTMLVSYALVAAVAEVWALWTAAFVLGVGMAFLYPALMAAVVNRVDEHERSTALSSFTMFFELGSMVGGLTLGAVAQVFGKQAGFAGGVVLCLAGLAVLWTRVADPREPMVVVVPAQVEFRPVAGD
jgi:MFS family permease